MPPKGKSASPSPKKGRASPSPATPAKGSKPSNSKNNTVAEELLAAATAQSPAVSPTKPAMDPEEAASLVLDAYRIKTVMESVAGTQPQNETINNDFYNFMHYHKLKLKEDEQIIQNRAETKRSRIAQRKIDLDEARIRAMRTDPKNLMKCATLIQKHIRGLNERRMVAKGREYLTERTRKVALVIISDYFTNSAAQRIPIDQYTVDEGLKVAQTLLAAGYHVTVMSSTAALMGATPIPQVHSGNKATTSAAALAAIAAASASVLPDGSPAPIRYATPISAAELLAPTKANILKALSDLATLCDNPDTMAWVHICGPGGIGVISGKNPLKARDESENIITPRHRMMAALEAFCSEELSRDKDAIPFLLPSDLKASYEERLSHDDVIQIEEILGMIMDPKASQSSLGFANSRPCNQRVVSFDLSHCGCDGQLGSFSGIVSSIGGGKVFRGPRLPSQTQQMQAQSHQQRRRSTAVSPPPAPVAKDSSPSTKGKSTFLTGTTELNKDPKEALSAPSSKPTEEVVDSSAQFLELKGIFTHALLLAIHGHAWQLCSDEDISRSGVVAAAGSATPGLPNASPFAAPTAPPAISVNNPSDAPPPCPFNTVSKGSQFALFAGRPQLHASADLSPFEFEGSLMVPGAHAPLDLLQINLEGVSRRDSSAVKKAPSTIVASKAALFPAVKFRTLLKFIEFYMTAHGAEPQDVDIRCLHDAKTGAYSIEEQKKMVAEEQKNAAASSGASSPYRALKTSPEKAITSTTGGSTTQQPWRSQSLTTVLSRGDWADFFVIGGDKSRVDGAFGVLQALETATLSTTTSAHQSPLLTVIGALGSVFAPQRQLPERLMLHLTSVPEAQQFFEDLVDQEEDEREAMEKAREAGEPVQPLPSNSSNLAAMANAPKPNKSPNTFPTSVGRRTTTFALSSSFDDGALPNVQGSSAQSIFADTLPIFVKEATVVRDPNQEQCLLPVTVQQFQDLAREHRRSAGLNRQVAVNATINIDHTQQLKKISEEFRRQVSTFDVPPQIGISSSGVMHVKKGLLELKLPPVLLCQSTSFLSGGGSSVAFAAGGRGGATANPAASPSKAAAQQLSPLSPEAIRSTGPLVSAAAASPLSALTTARAPQALLPQLGGGSLPQQQSPSAPPISKVAPVLNQSLDPEFASVLGHYLNIMSQPDPSAPLQRHSLASRIHINNRSLLRRNLTIHLRIMNPSTVMATLAELNAHLVEHNKSIPLLLQFLFKGSGCGHFLPSAPPADSSANTAPQTLLAAAAGGKSAALPPLINGGASAHQQHGALPLDRVPPTLVFSEVSAAQGLDIMYSPCPAFYTERTMAQAQTVGEESGNNSTTLAPHTHPIATIFYSVRISDDASTVPNSGAMAATNRSHLSITLYNLNDDQTSTVVTRAPLISDFVAPKLRQVSHAAHNAGLPQSKPAPSMDSYASHSHSQSMKLSGAFPLAACPSPFSFCEAPYLPRIAVSKIETNITVSAFMPADAAKNLQGQCRGLMPIVFHAEALGMQKAASMGYLFSKGGGFGGRGVRAKSIYGGVAAANAKNVVTPPSLAVAQPVSKVVAELQRIANDAYPTSRLGGGATGHVASHSLFANASRVGRRPQIRATHSSRLYSEAFAEKCGFGAVPGIDQMTMMEHLHGTVSSSNAVANVVAAAGGDTHGHASSGVGHGSVLLSNSIAGGAGASGAASHRLTNLIRIFSSSASVKDCTVICPNAISDWDDNSIRSLLTLETSTPHLINAPPQKLWQPTKPIKGVLAPSDKGPVWSVGEADADTIGAPSRQQLEELELAQGKNSSNEASLRGKGEAELDEDGRPIASISSLKGLLATTSSSRGVDSAADYNPGVRLGEAAALQSKILSRQISALTDAIVKTYSMFPPAPLRYRVPVMATEEKEGSITGVHRGGGANSKGGSHTSIVDSQQAVKTLDTVALGAAEPASTDAASTTKLNKNQRGQSEDKEAPAIAGGLSPLHKTTSFILTPAKGTNDKLNTSLRGSPLAAGSPLLNNGPKKRATDQAHKSGGILLGSNGPDGAVVLGGGQSISRVRGKIKQVAPLLAAIADAKNGATLVTSSESLIDGGADAPPAVSLSIETLKRAMEATTARDRELAAKRRQVTAMKELYRSRVAFIAQCYPSLQATPPLAAPATHYHPAVCILAFNNPITMSPSANLHSLHGAASGAPQKPGSLATGTHQQPHPQQISWTEMRLRQLQEMSDAQKRFALSGNIQFAFWDLSPPGHSQSHHHTPQGYTVGAPANTRSPLDATPFTMGGMMAPSSPGPTASTTPTALSMYTAYTNVSQQLFMPINKLMAVADRTRQAAQPFALAEQQSNALYTASSFAMHHQGSGGGVPAAAFGGETLHGAGNMSPTGAKKDGRDNDDRDQCPLQSLKQLVRSTLLPPADYPALLIAEPHRRRLYRVLWSGVEYYPSAVISHFCDEFLRGSLLELLPPVKGARVTGPPQRMRYVLVGVY